MLHNFRTLPAEGKIKMLLLRHVWLFLCYSSLLLLIEMHLLSLIFLSSGLTARSKTYFCNNGCSGSAVYSSISTSLFILIIFPYNFLVQWFSVFSIFFDFRAWFFKFDFWTLFLKTFYISKIRDYFERIIFTNNLRRPVMLRQLERNITPLY